MFNVLQANTNRELDIECIDCGNGVYTLRPHSMRETLELALTLSSLLSWRKDKGLSREIESLAFNPTGNLLVVFRQA
jgi:hypothetical protein